MACVLCSSHRPACPRVAWEFAGRIRRTRRRDARLHRRRRHPSGRTPARAARRRRAPAREAPAHPAVRAGVHRTQARRGGAHAHLGAAGAHARVDRHARRAGQRHAAGGSRRDLRDASGVRRAARAQHEATRRAAERGLRVWMGRSLAVRATSCVLVRCAHYALLDHLAVTACLLQSPIATYTQPESGVVREVFDVPSFRWEDEGDKPLKVRLLITRRRVERGHKVAVGVRRGAYVLHSS